MDTQIITMPNQKVLADQAILRNAQLAATVPPAGIQLCCGAVPAMKRGGAILTSLKCPVCGREGGCWSLDDNFLVQCWNEGNWGDPRVACLGETAEIFCLRALNLDYLEWSSHGGFLGFFPARHSIDWALVSNPAPGIFRLHSRKDQASFVEVSFAPPKRSGNVYSLGWEKDQCVYQEYQGELALAKYLSLSAHNHKWSEVLKKFHNEAEALLRPAPFKQSEAA